MKRQPFQLNYIFFFQKIKKIKVKKVVQIKAVEENGDNIKNGKEKVSDGCGLNWKSEGRVRLPTFHQFFEV